MDNCFNSVRIFGKNTADVELFSADATELFNIAAKYRSVDFATGDAAIAVDVGGQDDGSVVLDVQLRLAERAGNILQAINDGTGFGLYATMAGPLMLTVTADTTLSLEQIKAAGYSGLVVVVKAAGAVQITVPVGCDSGVSFAVCPTGQGPVTFAGGDASVTFTMNTPTGLIAQPRGAYSMVTVMCLTSASDNTDNPNTEEWVIMGDLAQTE